MNVEGEKRSEGRKENFSPVCELIIQRDNWKVNKSKKGIFLKQSGKKLQY